MKPWYHERSTNFINLNLFLEPGTLVKLTYKNWNDNEYNYGIVIRMTNKMTDRRWAKFDILVGDQILNLFAYEFEPCQPL